MIETRVNAGPYASGGYLAFDCTVRRFLPFARLLLMTLRPPGESILSRNPCVRARLRFLGWYVRFIYVHHPLTGTQKNAPVEAVKDDTTTYESVQASHWFHHRPALRTLAKSIAGPQYRASHTHQIAFL